MIWCLLVAVPVFGVSATLVDLLGPLHIHRTAAVPAATGPMAGWIDMRRGPGITTVPAVHVHSHGLFARHHHELGDTDVIALDAGLLQGSASDDGGASAASLSHVMAMSDVAALVTPPTLRFAWLVATSAAAMPWTAEGPLRPPRA